MTRTRAALLLAAIFVAGTATGAMGTAVWMRHRGRAAGWSPARVEGMMLRRMARRLDLDEPQRQALQGIAADTRTRMDAVRRQAMEQVGEALDQAYDRLEPALRPEQRQTLEQMRREARSRFARPPGSEKTP